MDHHRSLFRLVTITMLLKVEQIKDQVSSLQGQLKILMDLLKDPLVVVRLKS